MEVEDIIQEIIDQEDEQIKQQIDSKNKEEVNNKKELGTVKKTRIILIAIIGLFILMTVFPWFELGGSTTYHGFVRMPKNIISKEYKELNVKEQKIYEGVFVEASPVDLVIYVFDYFDNYKTIQDEQGNEGFSIFSFLHIIYIISYIVMVLLALVSIGLLLALKELKGIKLVIYFSLASMFIFLINFVVMKISYFNMFALRALTELRSLEGSSSVIMTQKGIAVNTVFYPYSMTLTVPFFIAFGLLIIWIFASLVINKIKIKRELYARLND
ncbi:MAG: hypothetical protein CVV02_12925 [Firmicutes bacterium HGW-Firmicutes-7]|nr:MAG: hypothetical protein CVV02_12925 [Firmicutes bacterium HGW-Firmicutes-7]